MRLAAPSLPMMEATWNLTVCSEIVEARSDLLVAKACREELKYFQFAGCQRFDKSFGTAARNGARSAQQRFDAGCVEDHQACGCRPNRRHNFRSRSEPLLSTALTPARKRFRNRLGGRIVHQHNHGPARARPIHGLTRGRVGKRPGFHEQHIGRRIPSDPRDRLRRNPRLSAGPGCA